MINRHSGGYTPNKDWPANSWTELVERLTAVGTVIDIGVKREIRSREDPANYIDLVGKTTLRQLVAAIAAADILISPSSGPVHIAAAVGTPAVVIYGGFENAVGTSYSGNIGLETALECSPCYLRILCPFDKECLKRISPSMVEKSVYQIWGITNHRLQPG